MGHNRAVTRACGIAGYARAFGAALALIAAASLAGCQSKDSGAPPRSDVPKGFDVPHGVHVTKGGAKRYIGQPATVVYHIEQRAASAVTVQITDITVGSLNDFEFFNLPESVRKSTPYYVHIKVRNEGPSGLGGVALPIYARTSHSVFPPNELVGKFPPCP